MKRIVLMITAGAALLVIIFLLIDMLVAPKRPVAMFEKGIPQEAVPAKRAVFKPAPEFSLQDVNGIEVKLSDFKNKVVIIDFWATWCPPCRQEIPHFIGLYSQYKGQGLEIIGIALDTKGAKVVPLFVEQNSINYAVLLGNQDVADLYGGIAAIPTTFIVDREGNISKKYIGYNDKEVFERDIKELL